ncbi:MAG: 30S ribosomal protein S8 [Lentisphaerae bacterium]|nr:30S ribosomal protein S8 [Lentisphaerota bacterium]
MSVSDPISDMLVRLRNASVAKTDVLEMPHSKMRDALARILKKEGFIFDFTAEGGKARKILRLYLRFTVAGRERISVIRGLRRISRPGQRHYVGAGEIKPVRNGTGIAILSTSKGVMTDNDARRDRLGGELLCEIW